MTVIAQQPTKLDMFMQYLDQGSALASGNVSNEITEIFSDALLVFGNILADGLMAS